MIDTCSVRRLQTFLVAVSALPLRAGRHRACEGNGRAATPPAVTPRRSSAPARSTRSLWHRRACLGPARPRARRPTRPASSADASLEAQEGWLGRRGPSGAPACAGAGPSAGPARPAERNSRTSAASGTRPHRARACCTPSFRTPSRRHWWRRGGRAGRTTGACEAPHRTLEIWCRTRTAGTRRWWRPGARAWRTTGAASRQASRKRRTSRSPPRTSPASRSSHLHARSTGARQSPGSPPTESGPRGSLQMTSIIFCLAARRQLMRVVVFGAATGSAAVAFAAAILRMLRDAFVMLRSVVV